MEWFHLQALDAVVFILGVAAGMVGSHVKLPQRSLPLTGRSKPEHVHDWKLNSTEFTAGRHWEVYVCWGHPQPAIERRELVEDDSGRPE